MKPIQTYTVFEVAKLFRCQPAYIRKLARERKLDVMIIARKLLFPEDSVHEYQKKHLFKTK